MTEEPGPLARAVQYLKDQNARAKESREADAVIQKHSKSLFRRVIAENFNFHRSAYKKISEQEQNDGKSDLDRDMVRWTRAVANYTCWLAIVGSLGALISILTLGAIKGQWDVMEFDERPWISLSGLPTIEGPLTKMFADAFAITLRVPIKNTGKSPARRIIIQAKIFDIWLISSVVDEQKTLCNKDGDNFPREAKYREFNVFSNDGYGMPVIIVFDGDIDKLRRLHLGKAMLNGVIVGCVSYQFMNSETWHTTGFMFDLNPAAPQTQPPYGFDLDQVPIRPADMHLNISNYGTGAAD